MARRPRRRAPSAKPASIIENSRIALIVPDAMRFLSQVLDRQTFNAPVVPGLRWRRLDFVMQHQQQSRWCWAAVAASVALYYDPASTWTQCEVANRQFKKKDCCGADASGPCNKDRNLQSSLTIVGHLDPPFVVGPATFAQAQGETDGGRPLGVRTVWSNNRGAHFVAIIGYQPLFEMLAVDDPKYGKSDVDYTAFCTDYQNGDGTWSHTFFTKR